MSSKVKPLLKTKRSGSTAKKAAPSGGMRKSHSRNLVREIPTKASVENLRVQIATLRADRKKLKESGKLLKAREARFREALEGILVPFSLFSAIRDPSGRIVDFRFDYVNPAGCRANNLPLEETLGKGLLEIFPGHLETGLFYDYCRLVQTGEPVVRDLAYYRDKERKEGLIKAFTIRAVKMGDGFSVTWNDVTDQVAAREALQESESRFRSLADLLPQVVYEADLSGNLTYVNKCAFDWFGYQPADLEKGLNVLQMVVPEDRDKVKRNIPQVFSGNRVGAEQYHAQRKDGVTFPILIYSSPIVRNGQPKGLRGLLVDISDLVKAQDAVRESEARFRDMANLLPVIIYERDMSGKVTYSNHYGFDATGYTMEDIQQGLNVLDLVIPEEREKVKNSVSRLRSNQWAKGEEFSALRKDGTSFPSLLYAVPIVKDSRMCGLRGALIDITERKKAEERLKSSLEEKDVLLRELYHRTKNNMQVISSMLELQSNLARDDRVSEVCDIMKNRILAMSMVHQKLYQSKNLSNLDLGEYLQDLANKLLKSYHVSGCPVGLSCDLEPIQALIDVAIPCGLILNELISNCLKYAFKGKPGGEIKLGLRRVPPQFIQLELADNGVGLPSGYNYLAQKSLGMKMIFGIGEKQLGGRVEYKSTNGLAWTVMIPLNRYRERV